MGIPPAKTATGYARTPSHLGCTVCRQEKWPHALQSQHFCVACGRERGSSPRAPRSERGSETVRERARVQTRRHSRSAPTRRSSHTAAAPLSRRARGHLSIRVIRHDARRLSRAPPASRPARRAAGHPASPRPVTQGTCRRSDPPRLSLSQPRLSSRGKMPRYPPD